MVKIWLRALARLVFGLIVSGMALLLLPRLFVGLFGWAHTYTDAEAPPRPVVIVFGAGLTRNGEASAVLRDRIQTAARLYFAGKARKLLMTGDNSTIHYNEPEAMRRYALSLGVPEADIVLDYAGRRTYDSCYRARAIFGVHQAILVTQGFHLPRALYLCNMLGIEAVGVPAENFRYRRASLLFWNVRELAATLTALIDVHFTRPLPVLGQPEPIFPYQAQ